MSEHSQTHHNQPHAQKNKDVYGGNFPKARSLALKRSGGKCQFCGLRRAKDAHHWAWPDYPSGDKVQHNDLTALCKPCHRLATIIRSWATTQGNADFNALAGELENAGSFYEEREALSAWLFPEKKESPESSIQDNNEPAPNTQVERYVVIAEDYAPRKQPVSRTKSRPTQPDTPENTPKSTTWIWLLLFSIIIAILATLIYLNPPWPN